MDESRFDTLTRTFATSRRHALKLALGGAIAGLAGTLEHGSAARRGFSGPVNPFGSPTCTIDGTTYAANTIEPGNSCGICDPGQSTSAWSPVLGDASCGGVSGRVCCNGECCSPTECCNGLACEECGPHCHIGGEDIDAGTTNPDKDCEVCNPDIAFDGWSPVDDGTSCNEGRSCCTAGVCGACACIIDGDPVPNGEANPDNDCERCIYSQNPGDWSNSANRAPCEDGRECCDGRCCPANQCCTLDGCEPCCRIGPVRADDGDVNKDNTCQICDASRDGHDWTPVRDREVCGANDNSECCNGECCPSGQCCRNGVCTLCDCKIGDDFVPPGTVNLANPCEICNPARNRFDWSSVGTGASCDENGGTCCGRDCCASDLCCLLEACGECLCSIENVVFSPREPHPTVDCLECNPQVDPFGWSTSPDRAACGDGTQQCCGSACCDPGFCCIGGSCQTCGCTIDGEPVAIDTPNPNNPCQKCDPSRDPLGWSALDEGAICDDSGAQCCKGGECQFCSCLIEGEVIADATPNPLVECQHCDVGLFPGGWSPSTETSTCGDGTQICCDGVCCPAGNCCNLDDICEPCRCEIGDASFGTLDPNPQNACQVCDPSVSTTDWTATPDYSVCTPIDGIEERFCCRGVCCQEHECCRSDGTCGPCVCTIEGVGEVQEGDHNPDNDCEFCNPTDNQTGWSVAPDGDICGPNLDQTCCGGRCGCEPGCLIDGVSFEDGAPNPHNRCEACNAAFPNIWSPRAFPDCPSFCEIDGQIFFSGTINPANPCQVCRNGNAWSPSTELFCGVEGGQLCCNGVCCEVGACCSDGGVCAFDACQQQGCVIDGVQFEDGTVNPANPCQICQVATNSGAWTPQRGPCGENGDRVCCGDGVCCDLGACCSADDTCDFAICQTCAIDGVLYFDQDLNPGNPCQWCQSNTNKFSWTTKPDNFFCDESSSTVCCVGSCCNPGEGCIQGVCQA